ncbi:hypothetical protein [Methanomethylovorans hollandica]|uniref:hypothetical protein n=1 Tax=Methanomethylovorans hollandica TaxID=101192 RepID=UPI0012EAA34E|nr:hypothetical protein [Methanomethylovorans hollandica]
MVHIDMKHVRTLHPSQMLLILDFVRDYIRLYSRASPSTATTTLNFLIPAPVQCRIWITCSRELSSWTRPGIPSIPVLSPPRLTCSAPTSSPNLQNAT